MKRTLYVSRPLLNGEAVRAWARSAGFTTALPASDMHVTIAFSREAVEWADIPPDTSPLDVMLDADGDQRVKQLGQATVLRFTSSDLATRWRRFRAAGASWDHPSYQPHITITYQPPKPWPTPPERMQPYHGPLRFGHERFKEVNTEWADKIKETPLIPRRPTRILFARRAS